MSRISAGTARLVRRRAAARCGYCHFPEAHAALPFQIDHIIARQHGGGSALPNLALACLFIGSLCASRASRRTSVTKAMRVLPSGP